MKLGITTSLPNTVINTVSAASSGTEVIGTDSTTADGNAIEGTDLDNTDGFGGVGYPFPVGTISSIQFEADFYGSGASDTHLDNLKLFIRWNENVNTLSRTVRTLANATYEHYLDGLSNGDKIDITFDSTNAQLSADSFPFDMTTHTGAASDVRARFTYAIREGSGSVSRLENVKVTITYDD